MAKQILAGRYELLERIGDGGMASVYRAHDQLLDRYVAIKVLHPQFAGDNDFITRFRKEAQGAAKLSHANIVNIYDVVEWEKQYFIVMEYVEGETLKEKIKKQGPLPLEETLDITLQIAEALEHAHAHNLIHCDIKPHNILIKPNGQVKVADFGIARAATSSTMTYNSGSVLGSVHYISPEQAQGSSITTKSDIYSLGVVMYEMLTGKVPFSGENVVSIALKHLQETPIPLRQLRQDIPPVIEAIVLKAMDKEPQKRFTCTQMIADIEQAQKMLFNREEESEDIYATRVLPHEQINELVSRGPSPEVTQDRYVPQQAAQSQSFVKSKKFIALLVVILLAGFFTGAFLSFGKFWSTKEIVVPNVVGQSMSEAKSTLQNSKLRVEVQQVYSKSAPEGTVVSQTPQAGTKVKEERLITIYVSKGAKTISMIDVMNTNKNDAQDQLIKAGFRIGKITQEYSSSPQGTVLRQNPLPGTDVQSGATVDLVISKGQQIKTVSVPNVVGKLKATAEDEIQKAGLTVGSITEKASTEPTGTVLSQSIVGGNVEAKTAINLVISKNKGTKKEAVKTIKSTAPSKNSETTKKIE